jgi:hypothetical protein
MALASGVGIAATQRPSGFHNPASTISSAVTMKAPTAAAKPPSTAPAVNSSAAPGVDQAIEIGMRLFRLSAMASTPMAIDSAVRPEAACSGVAPTPARPRSTTGNELAKPTKAASMPVNRVCGENDMRRQTMTRLTGSALWYGAGGAVDRPSHHECEHVAGRA